MKFEEQFPSLTSKDGLATYDFFNAGYIRELSQGGYFKDDTIQKYCLDKQRVKEVLDTYNMKIHHPILYKELGLE